MVRNYCTLSKFKFNVYNKYNLNNFKNIAKFIQKNIQLYFNIKRISLEYMFLNNSKDFPFPTSIVNIPKKLLFQKLVN